MIAINHVRQITGVLIPEFLFESGAAFIKERLPTRRKLRADGERVQPERLNFHWLADARSDLAAIHACVHPSELLAVLPAESNPSPSARMPNRVPSLKPTRIASTAAQSFLV